MSRPSSSPTGNGSVEGSGTTSRSTTADIEELQRVVSLSVASDFAHVFEVKAGQRGSVDGVLLADDDASLGIIEPGPGRDLRVVIAADPTPTRIDVDARRIEWDVSCPARGSCRVSVTFEPVWNGRRTNPLFPLGGRPAVEPVLANGRQVIDEDATCGSTRTTNA